MIDVRGIDNVLFPVGGLEEAVAFYTGSLGLPLAFRVDTAGIALFRLGDEAPGLLVRADPDRRPGPPLPGAPRLWLEVPDARAAAAALSGVAPLAPPFQVATGWTVELADPWGNVVGLTDYTSAPGRGRPARPGANRLSREG